LLVDVPTRPSVRDWNDTKLSRYWRQKHVGWRGNGFRRFCVPVFAPRPFS